MAEHFKALLLLCCLFPLSECAKIMFTTMPQGRSHIFSMLPLGHKLAAQGHDVTVFFEVFRPELPFGDGIKSQMIEWKGMPQEVVEMFDESQPEWVHTLWHEDYPPPELGGPWTCSLISLAHVLEHQRSDFDAIANQTWDLMFVDPLFAPAGVTLALMNQPKTLYMHYFTAMVDPLYTYYKGLGRSLAAAPSTVPVSRHDTPFWEVTVFRDRLRVFRDSVWFMWFYWNDVQPMITDTIKSIVPDFSFSKWCTGDSLSVYDYFDRMDFPMPTSSLYVSSSAACKGSKPLPDDLEAFVNDTKSIGTVLVSFGTIVRWDLATPSSRQAMIDAMTELTEFRIIWAMPHYLTGERPTVPKHIRVLDWLPQTDILAHPKTKLFMSHGGLKSVKEAICAEMPVLYMPMFAEQQRNAFLIKTLGFGEYLNKKTINSKEIAQKVRLMARDPTFKAKAVRTKSLWLDRIVPALDEAAFKVNQVLKHKGLPAKYFTINVSQCWLRFAFVDLLLVLVACLLVVVRN